MESAIPNRPKPTRDVTKDRRRSLPTYKRGQRVTLEEIRDALADEGYSANQRKTWLKEVLTDVTAAHSKTPSEDKAKLIEEIKAIIDQQHNGKPLSHDTL